MSETPVLARSYCPGCEPAADPLREILDVSWCRDHAPVRDGTDDALVSRSDAILSGSAEAGGDENRRWCLVIHGPKPRRKPRRAD